MIGENASNFLKSMVYWLYTAMKEVFLMIMTLDIGGTKTMWAFWGKDGLVQSGRRPTETIGDFTVLIQELIGEMRNRNSQGGRDGRNVQDKRDGQDQQDVQGGQQIDALCIALAGSVTGDRFELTNTGQVIDLAQIRKSFPEIAQIAFINDLESLAHSLPRLTRENQLMQFRKGDAKKSGTSDAKESAKGAKAILSIGTGLGISAVTREGIVLPSEGGHVDFSPQNDRQRQLLDRLGKKYGHVSYERLLSGQGLSNIYEAVSQTADAVPSEITKAALAGEPAACQTFGLFTEILGAACGNFALTFLSSGGIYLGGGMMPKILPLIDKNIFEDAFTAKGRFRPYLQQLPVYVILDETAPSIGAAAYGEKRLRQSAHL